MDLTRFSRSRSISLRRCGEGVPPRVLHRRTPRCGAGVPPALLLTLIGVLLLALPVRAADPGAELFLELCASCHTVGGGELAAPDLVAATKWPHDELEAAVRKMTEYAGPMSEEQIDALVALLKDANVTSRIAAAQNPPAPASLPPGDPAIGKALFFGGAALSGGGSPGFACHAAGGRGGNLARDLTGATDRLGERVVLAATERPGFPLMKAAYLDRPVTADEARHIAAYLATTGNRLGEPERVRPVHAAAGGLAIVALGAVALLFRARRAGVRERLLRDAERRNRP